MSAVAVRTSLELQVKAPRRCEQSLDEVRKRSWHFRRRGDWLELGPADPAHDLARGGPGEGHRSGQQQV